MLDCSRNPEKEWSTTPEEIRAYFGFIILMGINRLPELRDYWSTNPCLHYTPIASKIARDRFEEISRYLHFVDNTTIPGHDDPVFSRLQKVNPILLAMKRKYRKIFSPYCDVSCNEAMMKFKGQSTMKQYIPNKPISWRFKIIMGYC